MKGKAHSDLVFISNASRRSLQLKETQRQSNNATKNQMDYWKETVQILLLNMLRSYCWLNLGFW